MPFALPWMQWAAVISTLPPGLATTLAVQKCLPLVALSNSAPTVGVPANTFDFWVPGGGEALARPGSASATKTKLPTVAMAMALRTRRICGPFFCVGG